MSSGDATAPLRVLVVEDDPGLNDVLTRALEREGYQVASYDRGEDALAEVDVGTLAAAVLDVQLPGIDGVELGKALKDRAGIDAFLPVILTGGHDVVEERVRGFRAGCDDFLGKPLNFFELSVRLASLLARRDAHEALLEAKRELEIEQERKKRLAALVVHDLRNPLSAILGNVHLLRDGGALEAPMDMQICADLEALSLKALSLVASLLDVEEFEEGLLQARPKKVDILSFFGRFPMFYDAIVRSRRLSLDFDIEPGLSATFDEELVFRVVENLLDNAVRYASRGGRVAVRARRDEGGLEIVVGNDGPPVPPSEEERIFDRYYRLEARRESARANRGLGLYFCKLACAAHGGSIGVTSLPGLPACFLVRLPQNVGS